MAKPADLTILPNPKGLSLANALRRKYPRIRCASTGMPARSSPRGNSMLLSHRQGACYRTHLLSSARSRVPAGLKCPRLPKPKPPIPHHPPYFHSPGPRRAAATIGRLFLLLASATAHGSKLQGRVLVDAEGPGGPGFRCRPPASRREWGGRVPDERAHLMVQIMESWFLTQPCASNRYSDQKRKASGFSRGST